MIEEELDDSPAAPATHIERFTAERSETERSLVLANAVLLIERITRPMRGKTIVAVSNFFWLHGNTVRRLSVRNRFRNVRISGAKLKEGLFSARLYENSFGSFPIQLVKTKTLTVLLVLLITVLNAAPSEPIYPPVKRAFEQLTFKRVPQSQLPRGAFFRINNGVEQNEDPNFEGNICFVDIDGDATNEVIVESLCKGGNMYEIWQKRKGRWIWLLEVDGPFQFLGKRNGYYQVAIQREDHYGGSTRELYAFEGVRYHVIRIDEYKDGVFVGSRDRHEREWVLENNFKVQFQK